MYQDFAYLYDALQQDVPYEQFAEYYVKIIEKFGGEKGLCLDLGCGTGNMTMCLDKLGFEMTSEVYRPEQNDYLRKFSRLRRGREYATLQRNKRQY